MQRYSWVILFGVIGVCALIGFILFFIQDMTLKNKLNKSMKSLFLDISLLVLAIGCTGIAIYLFFDIQNQLLILERI